MYMRFLLLALLIALATAKLQESTVMNDERHPGHLRRHLKDSDSQDDSEDGNKKPPSEEPNIEQPQKEEEDDENSGSEDDVKNKKG